MSSYDYAGYDPLGRLRAVIEVKKRNETDASWATRLRDGRLERGGLSPALAFLLVVPERAYFWPAETPAGVPPRVLDLAPSLGPYFERLQTSPQAIVPDAFGMLVGWWLSAPERSLLEGGSGWPADLSRLQWEQQAAA